MFVWLLYDRFSVIFEPVALFKHVVTEESAVSQSERQEDIYKKGGSMHMRIICYTVA